VIGRGRSLEPSSSVILHQETANKVFGKRSSRLLARFFKIVTTACLPLHRTRAEDCRLQRKLCQADHPSIINIKKLQVTYGSCSQITSYIFNMLICVGMISLYILLQCLLFIVVIDISRTCDSIATLICTALVMFMIYAWIKIVLKVLIFPTYSPHHLLDHLNL
jgi:hypothetical protein